MSPRVRRPPPAYRQVAEHLRDRIVAGDLKQGHRVPSERELVRDWNIFRGTATKALGVLRSLGLVESAPGRGTTVRELPPGFDDKNGDEAPSPHDRHEYMRRTERIRVEGERSTILAHEQRDAPDDVRTTLGLEQDEQAICRARIAYRDRTPIELSTSWFPSHLATPCPRLLEPGHIPEGTTRYIERRLGVAAVRLVETDSADVVSADDAALLDLQVSAPILVTTVRIETKSEDVLAYEVYRYRGERTHVHHIAAPT